MSARGIEITDEASQMLGTIDVANVLVLGIFLRVGVPQLANLHVLVALEAALRVSSLRSSVETTETYR